MRHKLFRMAAGLTLAALLCISPLCSALAAEGTEGGVSAAETAEEAVISISTAEEFLDFARACTLDVWSQGKTFSLQADISLEGLDYRPAASFGGRFLGNGYTIRGLALSESMSPAGLFSELQAEAYVENLHVEGSVTPGSQSSYAGGLAGKNSGVLRSCSFTGTVSGKSSVGGLVGLNTQSGSVEGCSASGAAFGQSMTGGIAGENQGVLDSCVNNMYVNIESTDPRIDLSSLDFSFSLDLSRLKQLSASNVATDTGGVAGYNTGYILSCRNEAAVGYQHIGYNVGGVAGRSCGQISRCENTASICGRKDVGGIVGQMEPYIRMELSESSLAQLQDQLNELHALVEKAADDAEGSAGDASSRLSSISGYVNSAVSAANDIKARVDVDGVMNGSASRISGTDITTALKPGSLSTDISHAGEASGILTGGAQIVATPDLGALPSSLNGVGSQLSLLSGALSGAAGTLAEDVRAINDQFQKISNTVFDVVNQAGETDRITDTSGADVDTVTLGKISACKNSGTIEGDLNTGGVAGYLALEYALDPEDDISGQLSGSYRRQYEYKAILQSCVNTGSVTAKRNYAGAVCGRMDLGLITQCEGYGSAASESGSYVGGVAGMTGATIRSSYAKCALSGQSYVGGIAGSGAAETVSGGGSLIAGCCALIELEQETEYAGAICGDDAGSFLENVFVSDTLAGLNRRSVAGQAEPITFSELQSRQALPLAMQRLTLRFVVDDETVFSTRFAYGDSFAQEDFPELPQKEGCFAAWDRTELSELHADTTVTAVYTPWLPCVTAPVLREDGRSALLVEGEFQTGDAVSYTVDAMTPKVFDVYPGTFFTRLGSYFSDIFSGRFPAANANWEIVEQGTIRLSAESAGGTHTVRYLAPDGRTQRLRVYVKTDGEWQATDYTLFGSYLCFPVQADTAELAVVSTFPLWLIWAAMAAVVLGLIVLAVLLIRKLIRRSRAPKTEEAGPQQEPAAPAQQPEETAKVNEALLARAESAEAQLQAAQEELRRLRQAQQTPPEKKEARAPEKAAKQRRMRWWIPVLAVLLVAALAAGAWFFFLRPGLREELAAYRVLKAYQAEKTTCMQLHAEAGDGAQTVVTDALLTRLNQDGKEITCAASDGVTVYYSDRSVYLENGKAFRLGFAAPDYRALLSAAAELCRDASAEQEQTQDGTLYRLRVSAEQAQRILEILFSRIQTELPGSMELTLEVLEKDGALSGLSFQTQGSQTISAAARLTVRTPQNPLPEVPQAVLNAVSDGAEGQQVLTEEYLALLEAWSRRLTAESVSADLTLRADCGPLVLSETLQYDCKKPVSCIRKDALAVYFTDEKLCGADGKAAGTEMEQLAVSSQLLTLSYQLLLNGDVQAANTGADSYVFSLSLDEDVMRQVCSAILPESNQQKLSMTEGSITVLVQAGELSAIRISCTGSVHIVTSDAAASVEAQIAYTDRTVSIPQPVWDALT